jgi:hypothetical protein
MKRLKTKHCLSHATVESFSTNLVASLIQRNGANFSSFMLLQNPIKEGA